MEELKIFIGGGFWWNLDVLNKFFKFNLCCYNILKIKNILIININLSFSKKKSLFNISISQYVKLADLPTLRPQVLVAVSTDTLTARNYPRHYLNFKYYLFNSNCFWLACLTPTSLQLF